MKPFMYILLAAIAFIGFKENNPVAFHIACSTGITILLLTLMSKFQTKKTNYVK